MYRVPTVNSPVQIVVSDLRRASLLGKVETPYQTSAQSKECLGRLTLLPRAHVYDFGFVHDIGHEDGLSATAMSVLADDMAKMIVQGSIFPPFPISLFIQRRINPTNVINATPFIVCYMIQSKTQVNVVQLVFSSADSVWHIIGEVIWIYGIEKIVPGGELQTTGFNEENTMTPKDFFLLTIRDIALLNRKDGAVNVEPASLFGRTSLRN